MLLEEDLPGANKEKVYKIKDATRALLTIINDILDISKMEAGKMEIENINFHLPSLINDACGLFEEKRQGERSKNVKLTLNLADEFPVGVKSDPTRLRQVLINLIGNAIKFTENGSVTVEGTLCQSEEGEDFLRIAVHDTGIGITQETIDKLFFDFSQADASVTRKFEGSGLGLSICKRLVHLMGGEIGVASAFGKGSTFWFTLPYAAPTSGVFELSRTSLFTNTSYQAIRPLNILIAEDNPLNQQIIMATMAGLGHTAVIAENGAKAVAKHKHEDYDLILMDVRMPEMSGPDATRVIRQMSGNKCKIPIIALTADAMEDHKKGYYEAGMDDVVTKPIDRTELALAINKAMAEEIHLRIPVDGTTPEPKTSSFPRGNEKDNEEVSDAVDDFLKQIGAASKGPTI